MSKNTDIANEFLNSLKGKIIGAVAGLVVVFLIAKWDYVVARFDKGEEIAKQEVFEANLDKALKKPEIIKLLMENQEFVKLLFESPIVQKHIDEVGVELHDKIVLDVTKNDTNKVSMRSFVGMGAGVRDEQVLPILTEIVKAWNEGQVLTEKDVKDIVREARTARF